MAAEDPLRPDGGLPSSSGETGSSDPGGEEQESAAGLHETLMREVNERIERLNEGWELNGHDVVLCECAHPDCLERIEIDAVAYERVRRFPTRFLVKPDHVARDGERIVERAYGYVVVEKLGPSAGAAIRHDPRRARLRARGARR
jgi:hypothetical protein